MLTMSLRANTLEAVRALERVGTTLERLAQIGDETGASLQRNWDQEITGARELAKSISGESDRMIAAWKTWDREMKSMVAEEIRAWERLITVIDAEQAKMTNLFNKTTLAEYTALGEQKAGIQEIIASLEAYGAASTQAAAENVAGYQASAVAAQESATAQIAATRETRDAERTQAAERKTNAENFRTQLSNSSTGAMMAGAVTLIATGLIVDGMYKAARAAGEFDSQMLLLVTHAHLDPGQLQTFKDFVLTMAPGVGIGPEELAKGLYHVQSVSSSLPAALQTVAAKEDILTQSAHLAKIGHADLETTVTAVTAAMVNYQGQNITAAQAAGILNTTVGEGNMRLSELVTALGTGLMPVAAQAGVHLASLGAGLATLTDEGIPATRAATYLRSAIIQMTMPSGPAAKALEAIGVGATAAKENVGAFSAILEKAGINQTAVAQKLRATGSLSETIQFLTDKLKASGMTAGDAGALIERAFGGIRSGTGVLGLANNLDGLKQKEEDATNASTNFSDVWKRFNDQDPQQAVARLMAGLQSLEVDLGNTLMPLFLQIIAAIVPIVEKIDHWVRQNQGLIQSLAPIIIVGGVLVGTLLLAGGALGFLALGIGGLVTALPVILAIMGAGTAVIAAVGVAVLLVRDHWKELVGYYNSSIAPMVAKLKSIWDGLSTAFGLWATAVWPQVEAGLRSFAGWMTSAHGPLTDFKNAATDALKSVEAWMQSKSFSNLVAWLAVDLPKAIGIAVDAFKVWYDNAAATMSLIIGIVKAGLDIQKLDFNQAAKDMNQAVKDMQAHMAQSTKDGTAETTAITDLFSQKTTNQFNAMSTNVNLAMDNAFHPLPARARSAFDRMGGAIDDASPAASAAAARLAANAVAAAKNNTGGAAGVGADLANGIANGLRNNQGAINAAAASAVRGALGAARGAANSQSPSQVFRDQVGLTLSQGIAVGINDGAPLAQGAMQTLIQDLANIERQREIMALKQSSQPNLNPFIRSSGSADPGPGAPSANGLTTDQVALMQLDQLKKINAALSQMRASGGGMTGGDSGASAVPGMDNSDVTGLFDSLQENAYLASHSYGS